MVTRPYMDEEQHHSQQHQLEQHHSFHRYNNRGHGYHVSHDRELPAASNVAYAGSRAQHVAAYNEPREGDGAADNDTNSRPRSRIPVACGRCRKRKIRCSGDSGNGGPCLNCKNAGADQCQFLRVSSTEAQMKTENGTYDFDPLSNSAASRLNCRMTLPYGPPTPYTQNSPLGVDLSQQHLHQQFRNNSLAAYQYGVKPYGNYIPGLSAYNDFGEEPLENYNINGSPYGLISAEHVSIPSGSYSTTTAARTWTPAAQLPRNPLFSEQADSGYSQGSLPYHGNNTFLRGNVSSEHKSMPLPAPVPTSVDRVLPFPSANRPAPAGSYLRNAEASMPSSHNGLQDYPILRNVKSHNSSAVSESGSIPASYMSMASSSPESLSSSNSAYSSQSLRIGSQGEEYTQTSASDMYASESLASYGPSNGAKQDTENQSLSSPSHPSATLANGQEYIPWHADSQPRYPPPPPADVHHQSSATIRTKSINAN